MVMKNWLNTVYNSLLHSGSSVTRMLVDGAGRDRGSFRSTGFEGKQS